MISEPIYIGNSNVVELESLTNSTTGAADEGATVTVTLYDSSGATVSGETWPVSMPHIADGTYRATLSSSLSLTANAKYTAVVDIVGSGSEVGKRTQALVAQVLRDGC